MGQTPVVMPSRSAHSDCYTSPATHRYVSPVDTTASTTHRPLQRPARRRRRRRRRRHYRHLHHHLPREGLLSSSCPGPFRADLQVTHSDPTCIPAAIGILSMVGAWASSCARALHMGLVCSNRHTGCSPTVITNLRCGPSRDKLETSNHKREAPGRPDPLAKPGVNAAVAELQLHLADQGFLSHDVR